VAVEHYRAAATSGEPHAMAELGRCYLHGIGVRVNLRRGEQLLREAAEGGWQPALGELERYYYAQAERLLHGDGISADASQAAVFYRKAGELGHRRAAFMLGECYRHGIGIACDHSQALVWYRKAARLFDAKLALADMYYFGLGVEQNYREALRWYEQAVGQHQDAYAMYSLGYCLLYGQGVARMPAHVREGVRWLRMAAALGEADAQYELGCVYYRGDGVARSLRLAMKWLRSSARLGNEAAQAFLERVEHGDKLN